MKQWLKDNRGFLVFLVCFAFFRTAIADWNPIPSASMQPTLLEGDVVLVNRLAYDFKLPLTDVSLARTGDPQRGDVVTFSSPRDGERLIKRLVGLPGDVIELRQEHLFVNGVPARYTEASDVTVPLGPGTMPGIRATEHMDTRRHAIQLLPTVTAMRDFGPIVVPADHYFFLGDNRDNSADSRYFGTVKLDQIVGRSSAVA